VETMSQVKDLPVGAQPMFSVYDTRANMFWAPSPAVNAAVALRSFREAAKSPESPVSRAPEDYELVHVGYWYAPEGKFFPCPHARLSRASDLLS